MKNLLAVSAIFISLSAGAVATLTVPPASAIRTTDLNLICNTKTGTIRNVPDSIKKQVYKNAGVTVGDTTMCNAKPHAFEVDHVVSLENGGTNDISNLQLQAYCTYDQLTKGPDGKPLYKGLYDARAKDKVENSLHAELCPAHTAPTKTPTEVQSILENWKN